MNFKSVKFTHILSASQPASWPPWLVVNLLMLTCTSKQIDLTSVFVTI